MHICNNRSTCIANKYDENIGQRAGLASLFHIYFIYIELNHHSKESAQRPGQVLQYKGNTRKIRSELLTQDTTQDSKRINASTQCWTSFRERKSGSRVEWQKTALHSFLTASIIEIYKFFYWFTKYFWKFSIDPCSKEDWSDHNNISSVDRPHEYLRCYQCHSCSLPYKHSFMETGWLGLLPQSNNTVLASHLLGIFFR